MRWFLPRALVGWDLECSSFLGPGSENRSQSSSESWKTIVASILSLRPFESYLQVGSSFSA